MLADMSSLLDRIESPEDLQKLSLDELTDLSKEVRSFIIDKISKTGGHLAPNLGVVELTVAILKTFSPPDDKVVWDVSHQAYAWKILTDRKSSFDTIRQQDGISGFLKRDESKYDAFGAGHSGTAISAALGMAVARDRRGTKEHVLAVLGDGSLGCGIALEGFNNVATTTNRLIVILNDNEMSIAANVGSISRYLGRLLASPRYNRWKSSVEGAAKHLHLEWLKRVYYRLEEAIKSLFLRSVIFEEFGLRYVGPIDGHNIHALCDALAIARDYKKPILLHVSTRKGKGYAPAEAHPEKWHGTSSFHVESGKPVKTNNALTYSAVFGQTLERLAEKDSRIIAITAAMQSGTGLSNFAEKFPDRFFDVGICEEHAVVFAAGLATENVRPFFAVYSTFSQRAVDCIIHDVCLQQLPVVIALDRAGLCAGDGPTHHGVFDIALLRGIPHLVFVQPANEAELCNMLYSATKWNVPVAIRYPRGSGPGAAIPAEFTEIEIGKAEVVRSQGSGVRSQGSVILWALGDMVPLAKGVADVLAEKDIAAGVVNARFIKPLDTELLKEQSRGTKLIVTIENGIAAGGFGSAVEEFLGEQGWQGRVLRIGWPDAFVSHGDQKALMLEHGFTAESIAGKAIAAIKASA
jgi:1-deoxy-D-xylulose-5-phosphate synthase